MRRFNDWVALHITLLFGSMWTTYLFFFYGFLPFWWPNQKINLLYWSNTVQLWSLPLLMVGTNLLNRRSEQQAARQYEMITRMNGLTAQMHTLLVAQDQIVQTLLTMAEANRDAILALTDKTNEIDDEVDALAARTSPTP